MLRYNICIIMSNRKIKIIGLSGSPRANSNSRLLLEHFLSGAEASGGETQLIDVCSLNIKPCTHCDYCITNGKCSIKDDMEYLYSLIMEADCIAVASPIYFMSISAQLKLAIDRLQMFWAYRDAKGTSVLPARNNGRRKGVFIATGARNTPSVFAGACVTMRWAFDAIDADVYENILVGHCEEAGQINSMEEFIEASFELGKKVIESYK